MDTEFLINMDDGRLVFRNAETDAHVNLKPVPPEVVEMIRRGEVTPVDVVNAISAKIKENGDFNLHEYIEQKKRLNVRTSNPQEAPQRETLKDRSDETLSADEIRARVGGKEGRKARIKKINEKLDGEKPQGGLQPEGAN